MRTREKIPYFQDPGSIDSARYDLGLECALLMPVSSAQGEAEDAKSRLPVWIAINLFLLLSCGAGVAYLACLSAG